MIKSLSPALWVCLVFFFVSLTWVAISREPISLEQILSGGFPFIELLGVLIAGVLIRATRGRPRILVLALVWLIPGYAGWSLSSGESLMPLRDWIPDPAIEFLSSYRLILSLLSILPLFWLGQVRVVGSLLAEVLPCFLMVLAYPFVPLMIRTSGRADFDPALLRMDQWIFGGVNPHFWISAHMQPWLTEWFAFCYSLYGALILAVFGLLILSDRREGLRQFVFRFTLLLAIGYMCYALVPVQGPVFTLVFPEPMDLRYLHGVKEALMDRARIERDCFPSLHTALTGLAWGTLLSHSRRLAWALSPLAFTVPVACIALRYHYVVDVLAGGVLVLGVFRINKKRRQGESPA